MGFFGGPKEPGGRQGANSPINTRLPLRHKERSAPDGMSIRRWIYFTMGCIPPPYVSVVGGDREANPHHSPPKRTLVVQPPPVVVRYDGHHEPDGTL